MSASLPFSIDEHELLARFMTKKDWVRPDGTVKQDAFIPPKDLHLSVTRHVALSMETLWEIGQTVADEITGQAGTSFYGRADVTASQVAQSKLRPVAHPLPRNPNHAHIDGWPAEKDARKALALDLAQRAGQVVKR